MKLWLISQSKNNSYDTYDSAVVAADTETEARLIHPGDDEWDGKSDGIYDSWVDATEVSACLIGEAIEGQKPGVICASFNAG